MKIAIVGSGVSGLVCAHLLHPEHEIVLFEADAAPGGHVRTVPVEEGGRVHAVDTGFIVYNERHYPLFARLLKRLGVQGRRSDMSFSLHDERSGLEWLGGPLRGLFERRRNLADPGWWRVLADIARFNRLAPRLLDESAPETTLGEVLDRARLGRRFREQYLLPLSAALWSAPDGEVESMPARFVIGFLANHDMLRLRGRPVWLTVEGGSRTYVDRLLEPIGERLRLSTPVLGLRRRPDGVDLRTAGGVERFDHAILAAHPDQSLAMLEDADDGERAVLGAARYRPNDVTLHHDGSVMPERGALWASWNARRGRGERDTVAVTYWSNRLQGLDSSRPLLVSLNQDDRIDPGLVRHRRSAEHPVFDAAAFRAQHRWAEINGPRRTWHCGAWWGFGFHEDGVRSAARVCDALSGARL